MVRVGIAGANGYTGLELMRILAFHGKAKVTMACSRSMKGTKIADFFPSLFGYYKDMIFDEIDVKMLAKNCDVVFTALPHAASAALGGELIDSGIKVIDLSADYRYDDIELYESVYKVSHPRADLNKIAVYGLSEINREAIKSSRLVGNPGCYTTAAILALLPLVRHNLVNKNSIIIDAKSGISGAGRKAEAEYGFCETDSNFKAYAVTTHRHTSEIEEKLGTQSLCFTPHLLPIKRGILETIYAECNASEEQICKAYNSFYGNEKFVIVHDSGIMPEIKWAVLSNTCHIGYKLDKKNGRIIIVSVIDNLIKGASGQAIQNMNIMFSLEESLGLSVCSNQI